MSRYVELTITTNPLDYKFLQQIKKEFNIRNKIRREVTKGNIDGYDFVGEKYDLCLGAELFNEMLDVNEFSLERKRHRFKTEAERIAKIKQNVWSSNENKFQIGREELQKKVWEAPLYKIGIMFGVSGRTVKKYCNKFNISTPNQGYWAKKSGD